MAHLHDILLTYAAARWPGSRLDDASLLNSGSDVVGISDRRCRLTATLLTHCIQRRFRCVGGLLRHNGAETESLGP